MTMQFKTYNDDEEPFDISQLGYIRPWDTRFNALDTDDEESYDSLHEGDYDDDGWG